MFRRVLFTTKLTGEIDAFTFRYYENLFRELQVAGPFLNTLYFSLGAALLATLLGGTIELDRGAHGHAASRPWLLYGIHFFGTPLILYRSAGSLFSGKQAR